MLVDINGRSDATSLDSLGLSFNIILHLISYDAIRAKTSVLITLSYMHLANYMQSLCLSFNIILPLFSDDANRTKALRAHYK